MATTSNSVTPKLHIDAAQTVVPITTTDPRESRKILVGNNGTSPGIFRRRFHMILYHKKASDEDSGWLLTGWIKESLGHVLAEQPLFAGRVRRVKGGGDGELEIVPNDSGVRLIETRIPMGLEEFLDLENREEVEAQLVYWEDIDAQNPQFCPLFYVQVTNFKCGSYSIGLSCSLLLADPSVMTSFLSRWANIHNNIVTKSENPKIPIFYLPNLGKTSSSLTYPNNSISTKNNAKTFVFKFSSQNSSMEFHEAVAMSCIEEAEGKLGKKMAANISLLVKERSEDIIKIMNRSKQEIFTENFSSFRNEITSTNWDYLGADGSISFNVGNKPVCVSCWISSLVDEGLVIIFPSSHEGKQGIKIIVAVTDDIIA